MGVGLGTPVQVATGGGTTAGTASWGREGIDEGQLALRAPSSAA